jgi:hypothetical protein
MMPKVDISKETYDRLADAILEGIEFRQKNHDKHPYLDGPETVDELADSYCAGGLDRRDEMKRINALPFRPLHGR